MKFNPVPWLEHRASALAINLKASVAYFQGSADTFRLIAVNMAVMAIGPAFAPRFVNLADSRTDESLAPRYADLHVSPLPLAA
jgi:hypothetical protein